ncbi:unnamed protein product [Phaeothamnion confervicola]
MKAENCVIALLLSLPSCSTFCITGEASLRRLPPQRSSTPSVDGSTSLRRVCTPTMLASPQELWEGYQALLETAPLLTKATTAGLIFPAADVIAQYIEHRGKDGDSSAPEDGDFNVDFGRVARFAVFGFFVQAPWNHYFYQILDGALPPSPEPFSETTAVKVIVDQFVQAPIFTAIFFVVLGALEGKDPAVVRRTLAGEYKPTMVANWRLWVPASFVNIAYCPPSLRVGFVNIVFFFWSIFLSLAANRGSAAQQEDG